MLFRSKQNDREKAHDSRGDKVGLRRDGRSDSGVAEDFLDLGTVELREDRGAELHRHLLAGGGRRELDLALEILRVASLLDHELERGISGNHHLALLHEIDEARVLDLLDLREIVSAEKKRAADEGEGDGEENKATPVELRILTTALALAVVIGWLRVFV